MTQPTPYVRQKDFSQDEANSVAGRSTVLTAGVDAELDAIQTTLTQILTNLAILQRDDTKLSNDSVHKDALDDTVLGLIIGTGTPRGAHATATDYVLKDLVTESNITYICATAHTSGVFATDLANGYWVALAATYAIDVAVKAAEAAVSAAAAATSETNAGASEANAAASASAASTSEGNAATSETNAGTSESNALTSETNAAASASAAAAAVDSVGWNDVRFITSADSPFTLTDANRGELIVADPSGGNIVINLPGISVSTLPFAAAVKRSTGGANTLTINANGTDTIDGSASYAITTQADGITLAADIDTSPDQWTGIKFGTGVDVTSDNAWTGDNDFGAGAGKLTRGGVEVATVETTKPGRVFSWAGTTAPANSLALPLAPTDISRTTYADLFAAIGTTWGVGDGSTTFGMPYLGADNVPVQANANVGTNTVGQNLTHTHTTNGSAATGAGSSQGGGSGSSVTGSSGGSENLAAGNRFLWCVQY